MEIDRIRKFIAAVLANVNREMFGVDQVTRLCLAALYGGGNILLEGNPGGGKTELVKTLGRVLSLKFGRIQFTPDLMPSDITGTLMPTPTGELRFEPGPIFTSLLLADEINRATPKTQSAMLEAMAEKRATVLGVNHELPDPFMVLATQNPIDHEGTYNLPEAQSDRFMFKVLMPSPDAATLPLIIGKRAGARPKETNGAGPNPDAAVLPEDPLEIYVTIRDRIRNTVPLQAVESHVVNLCLATNGQTGLDQPAGSQAKIQEAARVFRFGFSARAAGDLMLAAKAMACLFPTAMDAAVSAPHLADVVVPVLRHRLKLQPEFEPDADGTSPDNTPERAIESRLRQLCRLTAPKRSGYELYWEQQWKI